MPKLEPEIEKENGAMTFTPSNFIALCLILSSVSLLFFYVFLGNATELNFAQGYACAYVHSLIAEDFNVQAYASSPFVEPYPSEYCKQFAVAFDEKLETYVYTPPARYIQ